MIVMIFAQLERETIQLPGFWMPTIPAVRGGSTWEAKYLMGFD